MNNTKLNGLNTQQLGSIMNTLKANPDASKVTFFVKTEWNSKEEGGGGFCVRSSAKNFEIGGQSIQRNSSYTTLFDYPPQFALGPYLGETELSQRCELSEVHAIPLFEVEPNLDKSESMNINWVLVG
jgi:hypothetical protein